MRKVLKQVFFIISALTVCLWTFSSCQNDEEFFTSNQGAENTVINLASNNQSVCIQDKDSALTRFAQILSRAIYSRKDVREFLKTEAGKKFDGLPDILYKEIENRSINGISFRNILLSFSSSEEITSIETSVPYLNIFIPEITAFEVTLDNLDINDAEIPVCIHSTEGMEMYFNGAFEGVVPDGELPAFHTVVINENGRVVINQDEIGNYLGYELVSINTIHLTTRSIASRSDKVGNKAVTAYQYFNKDDGSKYSKAFQRDYIYYGITPDNGTGSLNYGVNEYIIFMEVDPKCYFQISDQKEDPRIEHSTVSRKDKDFTTEELISEMWSKGNYTFRFEIITSDQSQPSIVIINKSPQDLWDFNLDRSYRHKTWFRKKKYTYSIDPNKFTAKKVDLSSNDISLGKWDLSKEAMERYVSIYETDNEETIETTSTYEMNELTSTKVNGSIKFGLGTNLPSGEIGSDVNSSTSKK